MAANRTEMATALTACLTAAAIVTDDRYPDDLRIAAADATGAATRLALDSAGWEHYNLDNDGEIIEISNRDDQDVYQLRVMRDIVKTTTVVKIALCAQKKEA